jgi:hypothetical protein
VEEDTCIKALSYRAVKPFRHSSEGVRLQVHCRLCEAMEKRLCFVEAPVRFFLSIAFASSKSQCCSSTVYLLARLVMWEFSLQERHQVRSALARRHTVFDNLAPLAEHSADILVPPCRQTPARCDFSRSHLLVICAAKPRYTVAAAHEHRRVLAPRLPTPGACVTSPLHTP